MALPKRRISKARRRKRRAHWKLNPPGISRCPRCDEPIIPHRACPQCGYYKNTKVIETE